MTVTTNYLVTGNGITGSTANAVQALVSGEGSVEALTALILNATALLALVGAAIGNSTYYVGDYAVANYVV